jgi:hypothetical protein
MIEVIPDSILYKAAVLFRDSESQQGCFVLEQDALMYVAMDRIETIQMADALLANLITYINVLWPTDIVLLLLDDLTCLTIARASLDRIIAEAN